MMPWKEYSVISETLDCLNSPGWMASANCRSTDPDLFYPSEKGKWHTENIRLARKVCSRCPVINECLAWSFETGDIHGILGGLTPEQRGRMMNREAA